MAEDPLQSAARLARRVPATPGIGWAGEAVEWSDYVGARVGSMRAVYGASMMISVGPGGLDGVARGVLRSLG